MTDRPTPAPDVETVDEGVVTPIEPQADAFDEARGAARSGAMRLLEQVTESIEQRMIREALKETKGNKSGAARTLGLTRQGLLNKIARYNI